MISTLRLFNAVPATGKSQSAGINAYNDVLRVAMNNGFTFTPEVLSHYSPDALSKVCSVVVDLYGSDPAHLNSSLHKSWDKVAYSPIGLLVIEQMMHYLTTYGAEAFGVYSPDRVFIPAEKLELPEWSEDIDLKIITLMSLEDLKTRALDVGSSGIALSDTTLEDLEQVFELTGITIKDISTITNRELSVRLYKANNMVPSDPVEFLRYAVYTATGSALLIKNTYTCGQIKQSTVPAEDLLQLFENYGRDVGYHSLASIFLRFKPLFLAFKGHNKELNTVINNLRRWATCDHKPMKMGVLDRVTSDDVDLNELDKALQGATPFRRIRILNALAYRMRGEENVVYAVRNGKTFSTKRPVKAIRKDVYDLVFKSVVDSVTGVAGKTVLIPETMHYTLPSSEKMFVGNLPFGSSIRVEKDMVFGVWWKNLDKYRIDLDLSSSSISGKIGWDGAYRYGDTMVFSGDVTDAPGPNGATELFHVSSHDGLYLVNLNYFNFYPEHPVPFKLFVSSDPTDIVGRDYLVDQNNVLAMIPMEIDQKHLQLGLVQSGKDSARFFFISGENSNSISFHGYKEFHEYARQYYLSFYAHSVSLTEVLEAAGATVVTSAEDVEVDLDLSPNVLTKDSILSLFA